MTATSTRARNTRSAGTTKGRPAARGYGAYVDGSSALQLGETESLESEGVEADEYESRYARSSQTGFAPPNRRRAPAPVPKQRQANRPTVTPAPLAAPAPAPAATPVALPRASFVVLAVALVVAGVVGVLVLTTKINENAFELDRLRAEQAQLSQQEQQLAQQLVEKESTGNLAAEAARLGLVPAGSPGTISLPDGQVTGAPQPGQAQGNGATTNDPGR